MERVKEGIFRHSDGFEYVVADIDYEVTDCRSGCEICHAGPSCDYTCPAREGQYMQRTVEVEGKRYFLTLTDESGDRSCLGCALFGQCHNIYVGGHPILCDPLNIERKRIGNHIWTI